MLTRRPRPWARLGTGIPIHPLLVAAVPALFLFAENADQQVTLDPLWASLLICIGIGAGALLVGAALFRDWQRGALFASLALALFFTFGHAWNLASDVFDGRRYLVAAWVAIAARPHVYVRALPGPSSTLRLRQRRLHAHRR